MPDGCVSAETGTQGSGTRWDDLGELRLNRQAADEVAVGHQHSDGVAEIHALAVDRHHVRQSGLPLGEQDVADGGMGRKRRSVR